MIRGVSHKKLVTRIHISLWCRAMTVPVLDENKLVFTFLTSWEVSYANMESDASIFGLFLDYF